MYTNGCTYGAQHACGKHGPRSEVAAYRAPGPAMRNKRSNVKLGPRGVWMARTHWQAERVKPATKLQASLLACATQKIVYDMATVAVRKRGSK